MGAGISFCVQYSLECTSGLRPGSQAISGANTPLKDVPTHVLLVENDRLIDMRGDLHACRETAGWGMLPGYVSAVRTDELYHACMRGKRSGFMSGLTSMLISPWAAPVMLNLSR